MKSIWTIARRDFHSFLTTPVGYIATTAFLFVFGVLYAGAVMTRGSVPAVDIGAIVMTLPFVLTLLVPVMTMRSFAEDRRSGAEMLYRAAPISSFAVASGKFLAVAGLFAGMLCLSLGFPFFTDRIGGTVDAKAFFAYVAFFFLGLAYIAVGIAFSSLSENQTACAVATFLSLFFLQGLGRTFALTGGNAAAKTLSTLGGERIDPEAVRPVVSGVLLWLNPATKLSLFDKGFFRLAPILYFISFAVFFLCFAATVFDRRRQRRWSQVMFLAVLGVALIAVNAVVDGLWGKTLRWDVTAGGVYSVSDGTKRILNSVDDKILIWGFFDEDPENEENDTVLFLEQYKLHGRGRVEILYRNPERDWSMVEANGLPAGTDISGAVFAVVNRDSGRFRLVKNDDILTRKVDVGGESAEMISIEQAFTGAIRFVTSDTARKVYALRGHGEEKTRPLYTRFTNLLAASGYAVEVHDLVRSTGIPSDAVLVLMPGPDTDIDENGAALLKQYLEDGGAFLAMVGFSRTSFPNLNAVLAPYGIAVTDNRLMESIPELRFADDPYSFVVISPDSVVEPGNQTLLAVMAREIAATENAARSVTRYNLLQTSKGAVAQSGGEIGEQSEPGIKTLGVAAERLGRNPSRVAVIGSAESFQDAVLDGLGTYSGTHRQFLLTFSSWLAGSEETEDLGIFAKGIPNYSVAVTSDRLPMLYFSVYAGLLILPLAVLAAGLVVHWRRKRL